MLLKQALEDAALYGDPGAAADGRLQRSKTLARTYMELPAIIRRSSRRYDQRVLEQMLYMPRGDASAITSASTG